MRTHGLHLLIRVALRVVSPMRVRHFAERVGSLMPRLSREEARRVGRKLGSRGTCLSRALTVAARVPGAEVVIAGTQDRPFKAHAWVEYAGESLTDPAELGLEIARF
jgi:hypothetical protein